LPLAELINVDLEKERLNKEITNLIQYISIQERKLTDDSFVANAPAAVVEMERQKLADAQAKKQALQEQLSGIV
jgi:valyl-tRNA synthetase